MIFFISRSDNVSFSRCLDCYVFGESTNFKTCDIIIDIIAHLKIVSLES